MSASAALLMLAAASATPATAVECPTIAGQTLVYVDLFDGPPEKQSDLAPDQTTKPSAGAVANIWQLFQGPDGLYVKCGYGKKLEGPYTQTEIIKLPAAAKTCRADFKTGPAASDLTLTRFSCK
jgi:hypothetical protein